MKTRTANSKSASSLLLGTIAGLILSIFIGVSFAPSAHALIESDPPAKDPSITLRILDPGDPLGGATISPVRVWLIQVVNWLFLVSGIIIAGLGVVTWLFGPRNRDMDDIYHLEKP